MLFECIVNPYKPKSPLKRLTIFDVSYKALFQYEKASYQITVVYMHMYAFLFANYQLSQVWI